MWFDIETGTYRHLSRDEGFAPLSQLRSFQPPANPVITETDACPLAFARSAAQDKAYRHLANALLKKLKDITCNNVLHCTNIDDIANIPDIKALRPPRGNGLPFVFAELDDDLFETLGLRKPIPFPLEVYTIDDAATHRTGQTTLLSSKPIDHSITYRKPLPRRSNIRDQPSSRSR